MSETLSTATADDNNVNNAEDERVAREAKWLTDWRAKETGRTAASQEGEHGFGDPTSTINSTGASAEEETFEGFGGEAGAAF